MHVGFRLGNLKERDYLIDSGIGRKVMLKCVVRNTTRGDRILLSQDKDQ
jgi:hypothetical protein